MAIKNTKSSKKRWDVCVSTIGKDEDGEPKTFYRRIGTAWEQKNNAISITFDALPVAEIYEGKVSTRCVLFEPTVE